MLDRMPGDGRCAVCDSDIARDQLMCSWHWRLVPRIIQRRVYADLRNYRKTLTPEARDRLRRSQQCAVDAVMHR